MQSQKDFFPNILRHIILAWLLAVLTEYLLLPKALRDLSGLEGLEQMSFPRLVCFAAALTLLFFVIAKKYPIEKLQRWGIVAAFGLLSGVALIASFTWNFLIAAMLLFVIVVVYALRGWKRTRKTVKEPCKNKKLYRWITVALALAFFLFVSLWGVCRVYSFSTPSFDFGIFAQMFHSMKTTGLPMTTLERDGLLSHFAVHVSPIYYLMLPFYCLVPVPATLQVLQAAVLASAVIPLWKLGKHHGLPPYLRLICCGLLLLYPAYSGGTSYDLHENCFLTPLILWLLYGIDRKSTALTVIAGLLTLMVKEDAAVYVAVAALWLLVKTLLRPSKDRWGLIAGGGLLVAALLWFGAVTGYLANYGDGVMTYRYKNFMYDGSASLVTVVKAVILNPMKAIYECADPEKGSFIALTLLPLAGIPLLTRRYENFILLIPYLLVNLMSDYTYQHDIFFQYTFGATAFLMYLTIVNLTEWKPGWRRNLILVIALTFALMGFCGKVIPKAKWYPQKLAGSYEKYQQIREELAKIPEEAAVASATFYTTHLSQREILYDIKYCTKEHLLDASYVVLDPGVSGDFKKYADENGEKGYENLVELLEQNQYVLQESVGTRLEIYYKE